VCAPTTKLAGKHMGSRGIGFGGEKPPAKPRRGRFDRQWRTRSKTGSQMAFGTVKSSATSRHLGLRRSGELDQPPPSLLREPDAAEQVIEVGVGAEG
jgi:hypothetical protein